MTIRVAIIPRPAPAVAPEPHPSIMTALRRKWRELTEYRYTGGFSEA